ncbi:uncharacterized protein LOC102622519 isoform X2 [Citrus sinensis]|uniref:uncharacterized protein LOC102622519 isoform X2 n=1 Tax=Citrus sinensis TaxID=2711 RepID=UPI000D625E41|nr:uncharacterized protein LOC102622519 isoform X2 [Citrus sinensis]
MMENSAMCDKHSSTKEGGTEKELGQIGKRRFATDETDGGGNPTISKRKGKRKVFRSLFQSLQYGEDLVQSCTRHLATVEEKLAEKRGKAAGGLHDNESNKCRGKDKGGSAVKISDDEVWRDLYSESDSDSDDAIYKELGKAIHRLEDAIKSVGIPSKSVVQNPFAVEDSESEDDPLPHISDNDDEMEGYDSEYEWVQVEDNFDETPDLLHGRSLTFSPRDDSKINLHLGKNFDNGLVFRHAVKAVAVRDGFNLCRITNNEQCVSAECSDITCDWHIEGRKIGRGPMFEVTNINPIHNCLPKGGNKIGSSRWIAYTFLHEWNGDSEVTLKRVGDEIRRVYGFDCPKTKLLEAQKMGREILGADHADSYTCLGQLATVIEDMDSSHKVHVETEWCTDSQQPRFKGFFLCLRETVWGFAFRCRHFIALDGWRLGGEFGGVMLTAVGIDANDGIWPVAVYEVEEESNSTWYNFLLKLGEMLRVDNGEGFCFISDGENGVEDALEALMCRAEIRICAQTVYERMKAKFPSNILWQLFWGACRSTNATEFYRHLDEIKVLDERCYEWLMESKWERWALHCMPAWAKCTHVTNKMGKKFFFWMHEYFAQSITRRMEAIVRKTRDLFERRYAAWLPWKGKLPPVVREKVNNAIEAAREMNVEATEGQVMHVLENGISRVSVDIKKQCCDCGSWQLSGIPCAHASKCILNVGREVDDFVDPLLTKDRYLSTYAVMMQLLPEEKCWPSSKFESILPPQNANTPDLTIHKAKNSELCCSKVKQDLLEEGEVSAPTSVYCCSNIHGSSEDYSSKLFLTYTTQQYIQFNSCYSLFVVHTLTL